ncbi:polysaccharide biosynthesis/export family protein [Pendulispora brunnea]|uniref:Polysaccharide biosynthesis/export family protein n=1 Tax=Pendulispora brunnea TaxID=2905690 RepID=A0ABZ2KKV6_9BACT
MIATALFAASIGCSGGHPPRPNIPAPVQNSQLGPGDKMEIFVVGEKDLPKDYMVNPDGTLDFPYVEHLKVLGLEPQQVAVLIRERLVQGKILSDPQVILTVKDYASKRVSIIGQVQKPGSIMWIPGMQLVHDAISQVGGFTSIADSNHVLLTRQVGRDQSKTYVISADAIAEGVQQDIPLQAGDTIKVDQRIF